MNIILTPNPRISKWENPRVNRPSRVEVVRPNRLQHVRPLLYNLYDLLLSSLFLWNSSSKSPDFLPLLLIKFSLKLPSSSLLYGLWYGLILLLKWLVARPLLLEYLAQPKHPPSTLLLPCSTANNCLSLAPSFNSSLTQLTNEEWCLSSHPQPPFNSLAAPHSPWDVCPALGLNRWDWGAPLGLDPTLH